MTMHPDRLLALLTLNETIRNTHRLDRIMTSQENLNADVASLADTFTALEAEVAQLKAANPALDLAGLDALVARGKADVPAPAGTGTPAAPAAPASTDTPAQPTGAAPAAPAGQASGPATGDSIPAPGAPSAAAPAEAAPPAAPADAAPAATTPSGLTPPATGATPA